MKDVSGRVIVEGGNAPRFSLPVQGIGRPSANIAINPQSDGTFKAAFPVGLSIVGAVTGTPAGFAIKSIMYGSTDLTKDPLNITVTDTAELVIVLNAPRLGSMSGRVTGLHSTEGVRVVLRNNTPGVAWEAPLAADGSFVLTKVFPGPYTLRVSYGGLQTSRQIVMGNEDLKDIDLAVSSERILIGHVVVENLAAPDVVLQARNAEGVVSSYISGTVQPNMGRSFKLRLKEGEYAISVSSVPAGFQVQSVSYGPTDLLKEPLKLDGLGLWEIVVRLTPAR